MTNLVIGMNCPNCGGRVNVDEGEQLAHCPNCDAAHAVVGDKGVTKVMYSQVVDEAGAVAAVREWLGKGYKARGLRESAKFTEVSRLYLPFWRMRGTGKAIVCGYRWVTRRRGNHSYQEKEYLERQVNQDYEWTEAACDSGDIGIRTLKNLVGDVKLFVEESVPAFAATTSRTDSYAKGKDSIANMTFSTAGVPNVTFSRIFVIPRAFLLMYYPFWIVRYDHGGCGYFATVDGVTGKVVAGRAPGDPLWQSLAVAGGSVVGGAIAGGAISSFMYEPICGIIGVIGGIALTVMAYNFFRHGSEIIEGDLPKPGMKKLFGGR